MFNKLKFNNLVISNKNGVQQGRTQTINKLVHKIRKLKTLLEKQPDDIKCKERIRKSTETLDILKKLKRVDIMKKLLLMDKAAAAVITSAASIPEEIAVALLSMNKVMQNLIKRFKTELKISELESDDWKEGLMESSKRKRKIERTEEKRRKRLELKQQKAMGRKRLEWLEQNQTKVDTEPSSIEADRHISTTGDWRIEELSNKTFAKGEETMPDTTIELKRKIKEAPATMSVLLSNKKQTSVKAEELNASKEERGSFKHLNRMNENLKKLSPIIKEEENEASLVVDPFFITDTGENYLSTAINKNEAIAREEDNEKKEMHTIKPNKFGQKRLELNENRNKTKYQIRNKWEGQDLQNNKKNIKKHDGNSKFYKKDLTKLNEGLILHPSWAAKQKLKPVITEFKGKKTKFDDDLIKSHTSPENYSKNTKSAVTGSNNSEKESLHPSWAAKQKLKPCIATFQGRKITFENDE